MNRTHKPRKSTAVFISDSFPWINAAEWESIYSGLFSEDSRLRKRAVGRVAAWKARASVPLCIELTADLVENGVWELQHHVKGATEQPLTLMYSMALTRFINGVSELAGGKFAFPASDMVTVVGKLNVPPWMVELRHDGTHSYLPSLSLFREGAQFALGWLKAYYWEVQRQLNVKGVSLLDSELRMRRRSCGELVGTSVTITKDLASPRVLSTLPPNEERLVSLREELLIYMGQLRLNKKVKSFRLVKCLQSASYRTLAMLMEEGLFLAFPENVEYLVMFPEHSSLEDLPVLLVQPPDLSRCWTKLLKQLGEQSCWAKSHVLQAMIIAMHSSHCPLHSRELLAAWAGVLLTEHEQRTAEAELMFPGIVDWEGLLATLSEHPGPYSYPLVLQILKHQSLSGHAAQQMIQTMKQVTCSQRAAPLYPDSTSVEGTDHQNSEEWTGEESRSVHQKAGGRRKRKRGVERGVEERQEMGEIHGKQSKGTKMSTQALTSTRPARDWEQVEDPVAWVCCPLGVCPGQILTPHLLELPDDLDSHVPSSKEPHDSHAISPKGPHDSHVTFSKEPLVAASASGNSEDTLTLKTLPVEFDNWPQSIPVQDISTIQKGVMLL